MAYGRLTLTAATGTADVGQAVRYTVSITDPTGTAVDPATLTLTIAGAATASIPIGSWTHTGTGTYTYDYLPATAGTYTAAAVSTVPEAADDVYVTVYTPAAVVNLDYIKAHLNVTNNADDAELQQALDAALSLAEDIIGPITPRTVVETHNGGVRQIALRQTPVISVQTVTERLGQVIYTDGLDVDGVSYNTYGYRFDGNYLLTKQMSGFPALFFNGIRNVTVTYTAGRTSLSEKNKLAVAEIVRHLWETQQGSRMQAAAADWAKTTSAMTERVWELFGRDVKLPGFG